METKKCGKCGTQKSHSYFYKNRSRADGLSSWCRSCKSAYAKASFVGERREKTLEYFRRYYLAHKKENKAKRDAGRKHEPWRKLVNGARHRSMRDGIHFDIDVEWGRSTYTGRCELTGLSFEPGLGEKHHGPLSPSIDRIDASKGYTKENCRWVCFGINALKGTGDDATMMRIAFALVTPAILAGIRT